MLRVNVHAGHNPDGKIACGAVGLIKESTEARLVEQYVIKYLKRFGCTVYNCTCDNGTSQSDVLNKIVKKCNEHTVDLDVSIHFNSGRGDSKGDGKTGGVEVLVYNGASEAKSVAEKVCKRVSELGFTNRGVKYNKDLYVLNSTKAPAMLIECCFVDDADDVKVYNVKKMAGAITEAILNTCCPFKVKTTIDGVRLRETLGGKIVKRYNKGQELNVESVYIRGDLLYGKGIKTKKYFCLKNTKRV